MMPLAFYAPLKTPGHPVPSGDRTMARQLMAALVRAGHAPRVASTLRSFDGRGDPVRQAELRGMGEAEADRIVADVASRPDDERPRLWFTYHCHYKAPDWIGPRVCDALGIPYVVAEGSRSARRADGPWAIGHAGAEAALDRADILLVMTPYDADDLEAALRPGQRLVSLPPFLDDFPVLARSEGARTGTGPLRLLAVAMMRDGAKLASFQILADALARLPSDASWHLDIVGDGPARAAVERAFDPVAPKVRFRGTIHDRAELADIYASADLLVWPAVAEAYGMVLLEAQACGCPVLAGAEPGVRSVVRDGETGILVPPRDAEAFGEALRDLLHDQERLSSMRPRATRFVREERSLARAARILASHLDPLIARGPADDPVLAS